MKPEFILRLTHNDSTVKNAPDVFRECKDAPVGHWGFTIGGASFDKKFVPDGTFLDNTLVVCVWLAKTEESVLPKFLDYQAQAE
jgi:hypothetical protein